MEALEKGIAVTESDPSDMSVGYGGLPDRDGIVTLDACIMKGDGSCGAVMGLEGIMHPLQVARRVMEKTPHVQLVGEGALQFALSEGFKIIDLLTPQSKKAWEEWKERSKYDPMTIPKLLEKRSQGGIDNHDTIGMLVMDKNGKMSGGCSTSGMAFKMRGRVGDSPIIGAGLFVDEEAGAATATGVGEEIVRISGAHTVVEYLRQGHDPETACRKAIERLHRKTKGKDMQAGFIAIDKKGNWGGFALQKGFSFAVHTPKGIQKVKSKYLRS